MFSCRKIINASVVLGLLLALLGAAGTGTAYAGDAITPGHLPYPKRGTTTIGAGIDADASNAQLAENLPATVRQSWAARVPQCTPEGGQPDELVSTSTTGTLTIALDRVNYCAYVSAYKTGSGKLVWRKLYLSASFVATGKHTTYVQWLDIVSDRAYVDALNTTTGKRRWRATGNYCCNGSNLAVGSGVVVNNGIVLAASNGKRRFQVDRGIDDPRALVSHGRIYTNSTNYVEAYTPHGRMLWRYTKPTTNGPGEGGEQPQLHDGLLYVHGGRNSVQQTLALRADTGDLVRLLPSSVAPLAFDGRVAVLGAQNAGGTQSTVSAVNLDTAAPYWTLTYSGGANWAGPAPNFGHGAVIANGLVWFVASIAGPDTADSPGVPKTGLMTLEETTGKTASLLPTPCLDEVGDRGSIGIAQHRIFLPTGCGLVTYVAA